MQNTSLDHVAHQLANKDACGRTIDYMRIAITDRCNYRCVYCMPASGVPDKGHCEIMSFEEIERFVSIAAGYGIRHLRLTGGEPLARKGCAELASRLMANDGIEDIAICKLTGSDVVRHRLVQKIIEAYEVYDKKNPAEPVKKLPPKTYKRK